MGKPQGIPFLVECMRAVKDRTDCHFVIVGDGTDYPKLEAFTNECRPEAVSLFRQLPKGDYDKLAEACDVGLIFLDFRFTIPNYPSRLLPYLMSSKPIIACTDPKDGSCVAGTCSCAMCKRTVINAGIETVIIRDNKTDYRMIRVSDWIENDDSLDGTFGY